LGRPGEAMGKLWGRLGKAPRIKKTVHSPNPLQTESIWFCEMKYFRGKEIHDKNEEHHLRKSKMRSLE
jgi:hypothetical protein